MQQRSIQYTVVDREYSLNYWVAGTESAQELVFCVHGLLRHSRDFDELVQELASDYLCVAVDLPGRGSSEWFESSDLYTPENYLPALLTLISELPDKPINWIGTSLGGILGMAYASLPDNRLKRLVLNDIGAEIPGAALTRIANYISSPDFEDVSQVTRFLQNTYPHFACLNDIQWQRLATYGSRKEGGNLKLHYDPEIAVNTRNSAGQTISLWSLWKEIHVPVLLVQGSLSDLLTDDIVAAMQETTVDFEHILLPGLRHAPSLMCKNEVDAVVSWLQGAK